MGDPVRLVMVPGSRALAWCESRPSSPGRRCGQGRRRRCPAAGVQPALLRHRLSARAVRPRAGTPRLRGRGAAHRASARHSRAAPALFEFLALLDLARIWAARGEVRDALATLGTARKAVPEPSVSLLAWTMSRKPLLRLSLGDLRSAAELARGLPGVRRSLLQARIALSAGDHHCVPGT